MPILRQHVQEHQIPKVPPKVPVRQRSQIQVFEVRLHLEEKVPRETAHAEQARGLCVQRGVLLY